MASDDDHVRLRVIVDGGRIAQASTTRIDDDGLERLVEGAIAAARLCPPDPEYPGLAAPGALAAVDHYDPATAAARPTPAPRWWPTSSAPGPTSNPPGTARPTATPTCCCSTTGLRYASRSTMAQVDAIHRPRPSTARPPTATARSPRKRLADLDGRRVGDVAAAKATGRRRPDRARARAATRWCSRPRRWPPCCCSRPGSASTPRPTPRARASPTWARQQFDERIDLWDDGTDPRSLGRPYDAEGTPKRRVDLVRAGVTVGLAHDRRSAALAGVEPPGTRSGRRRSAATPATCSSAAATRALEELIAGVERGLLVTDFWYNRILDPKTQVVTGPHPQRPVPDRARRGHPPVQNLRYTQSVVGALAPGHVLGIGNDAQLVSNEGGIVHVPSLRLASWAFTGGARVVDLDCSVRRSSVTASDAPRVRRGLVPALAVAETCWRSRCWAQNRRRRRAQRPRRRLAPRTGPPPARGAGHRRPETGRRTARRCRRPGCARVRERPGAPPRTGPGTGGTCRGRAATAASHTAATDAHTASTSAPKPTAARAKVEARCQPRRSGSLAPKMRITRTMPA